MYLCMEEARLTNIIESIIFASDQPVRVDQLYEIIHEVEQVNQEEHHHLESQGKYEKEEIESAIEQLKVRYESGTYAFELRKVARGFQFMTKRSYYPYVKQATLKNNQKRLSRAALETLSIIAYRQPVSKAEIEFIRGVNCDYAVNKLLEKKLVCITGRADSPGRPLLYGTSEEFMQYFGISDISDLPKLKEFEALEEEHLDRFRQYVSQEADPEGQPSNGEQDEE